MTDSPSDSPSPRKRRSALSPAARSLRLQRIFARLQDGAAYAEIAVEEDFSRERLRQIIRAATARGRGHDGPDHKRMQIARLTPALRLAADGVAQGDAKSIPILLKIIDRLDRYSDPHPDFNSFSVLMARRRPRSSRRGKAARTKPACAGDALDRSAAARPDCPLPAEQVLENAQNGKG
ncbi:MAG: hypothetical protein WAL59_22610 [Roseiarcus sp.]